MRAGGRNTIVEFQKMTPVEDEEYGGIEEKWATAFKRWAKVSPVTGKEYFISNERFSSVTHKVEFPWDREAATLSSGVRLIANGSIFDMQHKPLNPDGRNISLIIAVVEVE